MHSELIRRGRRKPLFEPEGREVVVDYGRKHLEHLLPHRPPFLLLDGIDAVDHTRRAARAHRYLDPADPVFAGHFPDDPVYPGVLQVEMVGQLGVCLLKLLALGDAAPRNWGKPVPVRLVKVHHAAFLGPVLPRDNVEIVAQALDDSEYVVTCAGQVLGAGEVRALAVFELYLGPTEH